MRVNELKRFWKEASIFRFLIQAFPLSWLIVSLLVNVVHARQLQITEIFPTAIALTSHNQIALALPDDIWNTPYPLYHAIDHSSSTTWVANDQRACFEFHGAVISKLSIIPGYSKNESVWKANQKVQKFRIRFLNKQDDGKIMPGKWQEFAIDVDGLSFDRDHLEKGYILKNDNMISALEFEVLEATEKSQYGDICISEIRFWGTYDKAPQTSDDWHYMYSMIGDEPAGNRLAADFDTLNFVSHEFVHEGTGGETLNFDGVYTATQNDCIFDGHIVNPYAEKRPYKKRVKIQRINPFILLFDGHLYQNVLRK